MAFTPEKRKEWEKKRKREIKRIINTAKDVPCYDCEIKYPPYVMSFDHVRGKKLFGIATAIQKPSRSIKRLEDEIAKCDIVCLNCHAMRHAGICSPNKKLF